MIGLIFYKDSKIIFQRVDDVQGITDTDVIGKDHHVKGIDLSKADFYIVNETTLKEGDNVEGVVDQRDTVPPSLEDRMKQAEFLLNSMMMG